MSLALLPPDVAALIRATRTAKSHTAAFSRSLRCAASEPEQQLFDFGRRFRGAEQKTLHFVATLGAQPVELIDGLHALRSRRDIEAAAKPGNRPHDCHAI